MKYLLLTGLSLSGFSLAQLLAFVAASYSQARFGAVLLLIAIAVCIAIVGLANWVGLQIKGNKSGFILGFAPAIAVGLLFVVAVACGLYIGLYQ